MDKTYRIIVWKIPGAIHDSIPYTEYSWELKVNYGSQGNLKKIITIRLFCKILKLGLIGDGRREDLMQVFLNSLGYIHGERKDKHDEHWENTSAKNTKNNIPHLKL